MVKETPQGGTKVFPKVGGAHVSREVWQVQPASRQPGGVACMSFYRRLDVSEVGDVSVVRFRDRKLVEAGNIQEVAQELYGLVEKEQRKNLLLNFSALDFLSSEALGKLITLDRLVKKQHGQLKLSNIRPCIFEVFTLTRLNRLFDIRDDEADALAAFS
jgi:anti-sigma B factor antagonist